MIKVGMNCAMLRVWCIVFTVMCASMCVLCARFCTPKCSKNMQNCTVEVYVFKSIGQECGWEHWVQMKWSG